MQFKIQDIMIYYYLSINCLGFVLMGVDKYKAKRQLWRIAEKNFFIISIIFGSIGVFFGCIIFRHKTKHSSFVNGIPVIILMQSLLVMLLLLIK